VAVVSQSRIQRFLQAGETAATTTEQGRAYEGLIRYVFETVPGLSVTAQDQLDVFHAQEIDVMLWNEKHAKGLYFLIALLFHVFTIMYAGGL